MPTIKELVDEIVAETRRVDKVDLITTYVKKAIKHAHALTDFKRDMKDTTLQVSGGPLTVGTVQLPVDFKKPVLVRPMKDGALIEKKELTEIAVGKLVEASVRGTDVNTFYTTGLSLSYKYEIAITEIAIVYLAFPDLSDENNTTWIMTEFEEALKDLAKSYVFAVLGDKENSNNLMRSWTLLAQDIVNSEK